MVKRAFSSFVNEIVNSKISSALADDYDKDEESEPEIKEPASKIVTTEDEIESFYIIRGLLAGIVPVEDIVHRDTESYLEFYIKTIIENRFVDSILMQEINSFSSRMLIKNSSVFISTL